MDQLWTPWRYQYVTSKEKPAAQGCVFCRLGDRAASASEDAENLVVLRRQHCYVVLNRFPYSSGHLMVVPYDHVDSLASATAEAAAEMMTLAREAERTLRAVYQPGGLNIGMNLGQCAGAGVAQHIHLHVLPRWMGDANFMTTLGETRIHIEELSITRERLAAAWLAEG